MVDGFAEGPQAEFLYFNWVPLDAGIWTISCFSSLSSLWSWCLPTWFTLSWNLCWSFCAACLDRQGNPPWSSSWPSGWAGSTFSTGSTRGRSGKKTATILLWPTVKDHLKGRTCVMSEHENLQLWVQAVLCFKSDWDEWKVDLTTNLNTQTLSFVYYGLYLKKWTPWWKHSCIKKKKVLVWMGEQGMLYKAFWECKSDV